MDPASGHMNVVLKWCICMLIALVDLNIVIIIIVIIIFCFDLIFFWIFCPLPRFFFGRSLKVYYGLRWMCCGGGVPCYVECTNVVKKW